MLNLILGAVIGFFFGIIATVLLEWGIEEVRARRGSQSEDIMEYQMKINSFMKAALELESRDKTTDHSVN